MIDKLKKYIRSIAIAFLFTILVETAILCFTNNTMYGCPDNAISIMDVIKAEEDTSNKVIEETSIPIILDEACIRTLYLQFYLGSFIKNILIYDNEGNLICENRNVDGSLHSLMILPKYNNQFTIQIIGKGKIKDILCSELDPKIEKKFVYNPLRMIMLFAFILWLCIKKSFISSKYQYTYGKAPEIIKLIIPGGIYVCVLSTICRMLVISQYKRIFFIMMGLCLITIIHYFIGHIRNIESLYLIISLIFTASTIMINPVFVYGGDSYTHFMRALNVAQEYEECDYLAYHSVMQEDGSIEIEAMDEAREIANEEPVYSNTSFKPLFIRNIRYVAYLTFASGLVIGDALNLSTYSAFLLGGIFNAWFVCTLFYIGMRQLKGGKLVLAVFSLLPYIVMNTCRWSYTPQIIGWITMLSAYIIGQKQIKEKITFGKRDRQIFIFSVIGLLPKAPYMFTFLLNEINTPQKFKSRKDYWMNRIAVSAK